MRDIAIFGLDGTIANNRHRLHLLTQQKLDEYEEALTGDTLFHDVATILYGIRLTGAEVWIITGRREKVRDQTVAWLKHQGIIYRKLLMRSPHRQQSQLSNLKLNMLRNNLGNQHILMAFDSDENVAQMWAKCGFTICRIQHRK